MMNPKIHTDECNSSNSLTVLTYNKKEAGHYMVSVYKKYFPDSNSEDQQSLQKQLLKQGKMPFFIDIDVTKFEIYNAWTSSNIINNIISSIFILIKNNKLYEIEFSGTEIMIINTDKTEKDCIDNNNVFISKSILDVVDKSLLEHLKSDQYNLTLTDIKYYEEF